MTIEAHNWLLDQKDLNRLSYKKLGDAINYSDVGIMKALKNKTLSIIQIRTIANNLDLDISTANFTNYEMNIVSDNEIKYKTPGNKKVLTDSEKIDFIYNKLLAIEKKIDNTDCKIELIKGLIALDEKIKEEDQ